MLHKIYPKQIPVPAFLSTLLTEMYPAIPWEQVEMYEGMPWFAPKWAGAIVLPNGWHYRKMRIYFKHFDALSPSGLSTIAHEGTHILQAFELQNAYGLGYFRGFIIYYNILSALQMLKLLGKVPLKSLNKTAYRSHPMEIPAYRQGDNAFRCMLEFYAASGYQKKIDEAGCSEAFMQKNPDLIRLTSGTDYGRNWVKYLVGAIITFPIMLANPVIEIVLKIVFYLPFLYRKSK